MEGGRKGGREEEMEVSRKIERFDTESIKQDIG